MFHSACVGSANLFENLSSALMHHNVRLMIRAHCLHKLAWKHLCREHTPPVMKSTHFVDGTEKLIFDVLQSGLGDQVLSPNETAAHYGFGTSTRGGKASSRTPGPGAYKVLSSFGDQRDSNRSSSAKAVFGAATRDGQQKVTARFPICLGFLL